MIAIPRALIGVYFLFVLLPLATRVASVPIRSMRYRRIPLAVAVPILVGLVFESGVLPFPRGPVWNAVSHNGLTAGSLVLLVLAVAQSLATNRRSLTMELSVDSTAKIKDFVTQLASKRSWSSDTRRGLEAVAEEALQVLAQHGESSESGGSRQIRVVATVTSLAVELEFVSAPTTAQNLEERIALLKEPEPGMIEAIIERDAPLRLLRHYASSVSHRQYQQAEIITAVVAVE